MSPKKSLEVRSGNLTGLLIEQFGPITQHIIFGTKKTYTLVLKCCGQPIFKIFEINMSCTVFMCILFCSGCTFKEMTRIKLTYFLISLLVNSYINCETPVR